MKKLLLGILLSGLFAAPVFAEDTFSLRGVSLGMNRQQVERIETDTRTTVDGVPDTMLFYELKEPVFGFAEARVFYYFTDISFAQALNLEEDRLYTMGLMFKAYAINDDKVFEDYRGLIEQLEAVYGAPAFYGVMEDGKLNYSCNNPAFESMAQSFGDVLAGRAFWYESDFYICANLFNNAVTNERVMQLTAALTAGGPAWNELTLKE